MQKQEEEEEEPTTRRLTPRDVPNAIRHIFHARPQRVNLDAFIKECIMAGQNYPKETLGMFFCVMSPGFGDNAPSHKDINRDKMKKVSEAAKAIKKQKEEELLIQQQNDKIEAERQKELQNTKDAEAKAIADKNKKIADTLNSIILDKEFEELFLSEEDIEQKKLLKMQEEVRRLKEEEEETLRKEEKKLRIEAEKEKAEKSAQILSIRKEPKKSKTSKSKKAIVAGKQPCTIVAEDQPCAIVAGEQPCAIVAGEQPDEIVTKDQPCAIVAEDQPCAIVAEGQPCAIVAEDQPCAIVAEGRPDAIVAEEQPCAIIAEFYSIKSNNVSSPFSLVPYNEFWKIIIDGKIKKSSQINAVNDILGDIVKAYINSEKISLFLQKLAQYCKNVDSSITSSTVNSNITKIQTILRRLNTSFRKYADSPSATFSADADVDISLPLPASITPAITLSSLPPPLLPSPISTGDKNTQCLIRIHKSINDKKKAADNAAKLKREQEAQKYYEDNKDRIEGERLKKHQDKLAKLEVDKQNYRVLEHERTKREQHRYELDSMGFAKSKDRLRYEAKCMAKYLAKLVNSTANLKTDKAAELKTSTLGSAEFEATEFEAAELKTDKATEFEAAELKTDKDTEFGSAEFEATEFGSADLEDTDLGSAEFGATEFGSAEFETSTLGVTKLKTEFKAADLGSAALEATLGDTLEATLEATKADTSKLKGDDLVSILMDQLATIKGNAKHLENDAKEAKFEEGDSERNALIEQFKMLQDECGGYTSNKSICDDKDNMIKSISY